MLFTKENVINLLTQALEDNGVVKDNPSKAEKLATAWLDNKIELGRAEFVNTTALRQSLQDLITLTEE